LGDSYDRRSNHIILTFTIGFEAILQPISSEANERAAGTQGDQKLQLVQQDLSSIHKHVCPWRATAQHGGLKQDSELDPNRD
jgi:hypothetical protein